MELLGTPFLAIAAALVGVATAYERQRGVVTALRTRVLIVAWVAVVGWIDAPWPAGAAERVLVPIGAYKVAQVLAEPVAAWWWSRRRVGRARDYSGS